MKRPTKGQIGARSEFGALATHLGYKQAVEVGVDCGVFADQFLSTWSGDRLWAVDPWEPYAHMPFDRTPDMMAAVVRLSKHGDRLKCLRTTSEAAANYMSCGLPIDFVYIDGTIGRSSLSETSPPGGR